MSAQQQSVPDWDIDIDISIDVKELVVAMLVALPAAAMLVSRGTTYCCGL